MEARVDIPEGSVCQRELRQYGVAPVTTIWMGTHSGESANPNPYLDPEWVPETTTTSPNPPNIIFTAPTRLDLTGLHFGIESGEVWGTGTISTL
jgi:hypothetical protein